MENIFVQISALLAVTIGAAFLLRWLRQPLIVAYIFAGIVCGPFILNLLHSDSHMYSAFAEMGVVLLLFIIGLNLNFQHLRSIGKVSLVTGLGQVLFTALLGLLLLFGLGFSVLPAAYLAVAITFSSTIIIMKLLGDKKDTDSIYGRYTIGLMLVQDVIAVVLILALGMMRGERGAGPEILALMGAKLVIVVAALYIASRYFLPWLLDRIADSSELLFLFTLAWCLGIASILYLIGFSLEIGAIMSGIALSSSPYQLEIASRIRPLRDFFLIVFFIVLGSEMGLASLSTIVVPSLALSLFILIGNPLILYLLFRQLKFTRRNSFLAGLTAAQVSEFGFVLLFAGRQMGHVQGEEVAVFTGVALITIFISSYLITYNEQIYRFLLPLFRLFGPDKFQQLERKPKQFEAWVVGYHRIGMRVVAALREMKTKTAIIDFDPATVTRLRRDKLPFYFGDIADIEFLSELPLHDSRLVVMTIPAVDDQLNLIRLLRRTPGGPLIIANAYHRPDAERLYKEGADFVTMPHYWGGEWIASLLRKYKWEPKALARLRRQQRENFSLPKVS